MLHVQRALVVALGPAFVPAIQATLEKVPSRQSPHLHGAARAVSEAKLEHARCHGLTQWVVRPGHVVCDGVQQQVPARFRAQWQGFFAGQVDQVTGCPFVEVPLQSIVFKLHGRPGPEQRWIEGHGQTRIVGAHLGPDAPRVVTLTQPALRLDIETLSVYFQPAAVAAELLRAHQVLGNAAMTAAVMWLLLVGVEGGLVFEVEAQAGFVLVEREPVPAQSLDDCNLQRADARAQRIRPQPARQPQVVLRGADRDAGKTVHHVPVGVVANAEVEDDITFRRWVAGVPEALHPGWVAAVDMVEGGRCLVADQVVLGCKHGFSRWLSG